MIEIKKVPLDFNWPLGTRWKGYENPFPGKECPECQGTRFNPATREIHDSWYGEAWETNLDQLDIEALLEKDRLWHFTRNWIEGKWVKKNPPYIPTPEEVNEWAKEDKLGHDSMNHFFCTRAKAKRLGVWGECKNCDGEGTVWKCEEEKFRSEHFEYIDPPKGEGFQLWLFGFGPKSPIFETLKDIENWCVGNNFEVPELLKE